MRDEIFCCERKIFLIEKRYKVAKINEKRNGKIGDNRRRIERKFIKILRVFMAKSTEKTAFAKAIIR